MVERSTAWIGQPRFLAALGFAIALWIGGNVFASLTGYTAWDAPPFAWLQDVLALLAFYVTLLILTTQRREDQLAGYREQLTLELAILSEQKRQRSFLSWRRCAATARHWSTVAMPRLCIGME
ncbi:DUF1003 domain-containing protein [Acidisphaera sp. L21]|uniref:DUF1003 domain-containing protein n=1 Tax=Acidisphaera sp. L21 TaxID=1641851 RepID=UPI00131E58D5|nr:DUF1003 domain-containing protein [Acidisphaera sp. L21]